VTRVLIVGIPRSGTTWVSRTLGSTPGACSLDEPDNHFHFPFAYRAKLNLRTRQFPHLAPADDAPELEELWRAALARPRGHPTLGARARRSASMRLLGSAGVPSVSAALNGTRQPNVRLRLAAALALPERPPSGAEHLVVKSVHTLLALDWLLARHELTVVVVLREPLNVLSSWAQLRWLGRPGDDMLDTLSPEAAQRLAATIGVERPAANASVLARAAWLLGLLTSSLKEATDRHPEWHVVAHEDLCRQPNERFRALAETAGLAWDPAVDRRLEESDRPGAGYDASRERASLPEAWRSRLSAAQISESMSVLSAFPIADWTHWRSGPIRPS
jgi:hypothetical protein